MTDLDVVFGKWLLFRALRDWSRDGSVELVAL